MKKLLSNQKGFGALEVIIVIVVFAIIGGVGFFVLQRSSDKRQTTSSSQVNSPVASSGTPQQYLDIKSWGVKMKNDATLDKVSFTMPDANTVSLDSALEDTIPQSCGGGHHGSFSIVRNTKDTLDGSVSSYTQIGNYYYRFVYPQIGCDADTAGVTTKLTTSYKSLFTSLQAE